MFDRYKVLIKVSAPFQSLHSQTADTLSIQSLLSQLVEEDSYGQEEQLRDYQAALGGFASLVSVDVERQL